MKKNQFFGTLDRIEGSTAVIIVGDGGDTIDLSKELLPQEAREGDVISFKLEVKDKRTKKEKEKVEDLIKKLSGNT